MTARDTRILNTANPGKQRGGKTVYGAVVGILMLETRFPRIPGDMGNAFTWPFPVLYKQVKGASPDRVVRHQAEGLEDAFIEAARELVATGADGLTTTCGFLSLFQETLTEAVQVPVASSSLMQVPMAQAMLPPGKRVGVITIDKASLTPAHLKAANVPLDTPVVGTDNGREFNRVILDDEAGFDRDLAELDLLDAAAALMDNHADIGAIVLECTNMMPYAAAIRRRYGVPVFSIFTFVQWFQAGLLPPRFDPLLADPRW